MLSANYGIYGPAYELQEHVAREPGSEEYLDSEKYQLRHWELDDERSLAPLIARVNQIRREHAALQSNERLEFHPVDDEALLAFTKQSSDGRDLVLTVASLDFVAPRHGTLELALERLGLAADAAFEVEDLLAGGTSLWQGARHPVEIDPARTPARILRLRPMTGTATPTEAGG
jgi:starch synthase (maltosyl-transferring)